MNNKQGKEDVCYWVKECSRKFSELGIDFDSNIFDRASGFSESLKREQIYSVSNFLEGILDARHLKSKSVIKSVRGLEIALGLDIISMPNFMHGKNFTIGYVTIDKLQGKDQINSNVLFGEDFALSYSNYLKLCKLSEGELMDEQGIICAPKKAIDEMTWAVSKIIRV